VTEPSPRLVMVAGPNGSGKSTLISALRAFPEVDLPTLYLNADDLQRERCISDPRQAQELARALRAQALARGQDLMYETVMSHPSKLAEIQQARLAGYHITIHLVATEDPGINVERIAARVAAGGHDVPEEHTRERYGRTLAFAPIALGYADQATIFDNSQRGATGCGLREQAALQGGRLVVLVDTPTAWVRTLTAQVGERTAGLKALFTAAQAGGRVPQLARLEGGITHGPIVVIGKHYILQYDDRSQSSVVHDRTVLGDLAHRLVTRNSYSIAYHEGVPALHAPQGDPPR
jgi:predicted ABC-type ATPase